MEQALSPGFFQMPEPTALHVSGTTGAHDAAYLLANRLWFSNSEVHLLYMYVHFPGLKPTLKQAIPTLLL